MIYLSLVIALFVGYIIGLVQKGITIVHKDNRYEEPKEYNKSVGIKEFTDYYDQTDGVNKF